MKRFTSILIFISLPVLMMAQEVERTIVVPKGRIGTGLSISYSDYSLGRSTDDVGFSMLFSLLNGIKGNMTTFSVSPNISYFIMDNTSMGLRFDYGKSSVDLDDANLSLGDDMSFGVSNIHYLSQSYSGDITLRHYLPIADSKTFAMFVEGRAGYEYSQAKSYKLDGVDKIGSYQYSQTASFEMVPGLMCFLMDKAAFELSIGVVSFTSRKVVQITNQVEVSEMKKSGANFKLDILSIGFGIVFFI